MNVLMKLKLTNREKYYVGGGLFLLVLFLVMQLVLIPFIDAKERARRSVAANEKVLEEMYALNAEYRAMKSGSLDIKQSLARRPKDFTLFSFLEKQAGKAGVKQNIKYMKPSTSVEAGPYKESSVEMKIEKITLKQLMEYLHLVESRKYLVSVKRISVKQAKGAEEYLTALVHLITYQ
ncbi:MAG: type II secretion system protein GspM [Thermodesulfobacteriota bacterium]|nr:type II secretion system protein GspM [Thermodesulfobacteriota bacterium]